MFESAHIKLTGWYLLIIMFITGFFSLAFYHSSTREMNRLIHRIELAEQLEEANSSVRIILPRPRNFPNLDELKEIRSRSIYTLLFINGMIVFFAGLAGYFLAKRTLQPIQTMMDEQTDFIANASHELRTPLATMKAEMESRALEKKITDTQARALIASNLEEVQRLQRLTDELLKLTQVYVPSKAEFSPISLTNIVRKAAENVSVLAEQKQIAIDLTGPEVVVLGNEAQLLEVALIFLDNAIKYSSTNSKVKITLAKKDSKAILTISDQGVGIAKKDMPHIFERFYRADQSRSSSPGFGLGLSIAQKILQKHGATIKVSSVENKGTTFVIAMPLKA